MSLGSLPVVGSRYPGLDSSFDVSGFLINGCEAFSEGSVVATIEPNYIFWDCRIRTSGAAGIDSTWFFRALPEEFRPPVTSARPAMHGAEAAQILIRADGGVTLTALPRPLNSGVIVFEARTRRVTSP